jgi:hypothetical protein
MGLPRVNFTLRRMLTAVAATATSVIESTRSLTPGDHGLLLCYACLATRLRDEVLAFSCPRSAGRWVDDQQLVDEFVASFTRLDGLIVRSGLVPPPELQTDWIDGIERWRPVAVHTDRAALAPVYRRLSRRFPRLYERLILSYRWLEVDLHLLRLLANPPGPTLEPLIQGIFRDPKFVKVLIPKGYIPFAIASDSYDPICFDMTRPTKHDDCAIVRFEHEPILCDEQIRNSEEIKPSFRSLVLGILGVQS